MQCCPSVSSMLYNSRHTTRKQVANDALGNLTRDVGMGIEEGTVTALISRLLDGPADIDDTADVIGSFYITPRITPLCIEERVAGCGVVSTESISYEASNGLADCFTGYTICVPEYQGNIFSQTFGSEGVNYRPIGQGRPPWRGLFSRHEYLVDHVCGIIS